MKQNTSFKATTEIHVFIDFRGAVAIKEARQLFTGGGGLKKGVPHYDALIGKRSPKTGMPLVVFPSFPE